MVKNCLKNKNKNKNKSMPKKSVSWSKKIKEEKLIPSRACYLEEDSDDNECCCHSLLSLQFYSYQKEKIDKLFQSSSSFFNNDNGKDNESESLNNKINNKIYNKINNQLNNQIFTRKSESYDSLPNLLNFNEENMNNSLPISNSDNHFNTYYQNYMNNDVNYSGIEI